MRTFKVFLLICGIFPAVCSAKTVQSGSVYAWGNHDYGRCDVPEPNSGFIAIATGGPHSLGLREDGSIAAWGDNYYGQNNVPSPNSGFIAIAAGGLHSLGLREDGSIAAWGYDYCGVVINVPSPNSGFIAIAAGGLHSLGLREDGSIAAWGYNDTGQTNVPSPNSGFIAIAAGHSHSLGLREDGSIAAWGDNGIGQTNVPSPNSGFIAIAAGSCHSLGLREDGSIAAWGYNDTGQTNVPSPNSGFIAIAAGHSHSLGLREDGSIAAWGYNGTGQTNVPSPNSGFIAIACGVYHSLAIKTPPVSFQYKGMLLEQDVPVYGSYDLEFSIYDTPDDANLVALPVTIEDVNVIDGHYSVELDFGSGVFDGKPRWLEILSRPAGSEDAFVTTGKREKLSPVPYALYAHNGGSSSGGGMESGSRNSLDAADGSPTEAVYVDNAGNVGIGTTSPSEKLDIYGTIKITGFKFPSGASNGYVLTSDSSGVGTWQALPTGSAGITGSGTTNYFPKFTSSTSLGNSILFETGGKIGIGTTNPTQKLEVQGGAIKATGGLIIETRTSDPSSPVTGQIWLRTDL